MRRILLVIDEFNELVGLETLFRRLGFDVLSLGREATVQEAILGFPPDLIIATGRGRQVDGLTLASRLKFHGARPRVIVLLPQEALSGGFRSDVIDAIIETPFEPRTALKAVCRLLQLPPEPILEKYSKIVSAKLFEPEQLQIVKKNEASDEHIETVRPAVSVAAPSVVDKVEKPALSAREARYKRFLEEQDEELPPMADGRVMRDARLKLQTDSVQEIEQLDAIARQKREFVLAMAKLATAGKKTDSKK